LTRASFAAFVIFRVLALCAGAALSLPVAAAGKGAAPRKEEKPASKPRKADAPPSSQKRQQELQSEQQQLKQELAKLKRQLMASEASRTEAADALSASEAAISKANRRLRELADARSRVERQIEDLRQGSRSVGASRSRQQAQLAEALRQHYQLTLNDPLQTFLAGGNPSDLGRDAEYYGYLSRAAVMRIGELRERQTELSRLEDESTKKREELAKIADDESKNRRDLVTEQARRKQAMTRLSRQIAAQRHSIGKLERDEKRLGDLIGQLSKVLADQARRDAQREAARAARESGQRPAPRSGTAPPGQTSPSGPDAEPPAGSQFAQLRGRLPMPVNGEVTGRFGAPRRVEGAGTAPSWKGIFIRAPSGTGVHAVAAGQVVFADWLRGFGNLMVIDHGGGFLSVYGNNESLLRNVGDRVAVGDVVASVGNTGGIEQTGLYFELRFQGRPFDPLKWVAAR
jgi:septal ring factor EnvC (AmiA/AmiB activator)